MAKWNALPKAFGTIHPRFLTPTFSTVLMGGLSILWTVALLGFNPNQDVLGDTISALGFAVCFYYGFTGLACAVYFRRDLFKSARNFFLAGLIPVAASNGELTAPCGVPIFVGVGGLILGIILMFASWPFFGDFFSRKWLGAADPAVLEADAQHRSVKIPGEPA